uniref:cytochrome c oxidase subunit II n=1 Tax=Ergasilus tumidus TaxID=342420 RepID=UPI0024349354|nr:cytochrome c oxidase subunit II [Ergasilus tumidus]WEU66994.1 cytochrome c oxidase subunit 2 [Ergasilus tumidus]
MLAFWNQYMLQEGASPVMEEFIFFHDFVMTILAFIMGLVGLSMIQLLKSKFINKSMLEGQALEFIWTLVPALVLVQVALPSLILLYMLDDSSSCSLTMKVMGHQWYWSYEYSDFWAGDKAIEFDSVMVKESDLSLGEFRLLETDNRPVLPYLIQIRTLVSSSDVIHSWTVPCLGVKADANPGRLNQLKFLSYRPGVAYGQCSEICGANHSFMPIALEFVNNNDFLKWILSME